MTTTRQLIYYILDLLKLSSDDSTINERHILFALQKYRAYLIDLQLQKDQAKVTSSDNTQTLCIDLEKSDAFADDICGNTTYLRSIKKIPDTIGSTIPQVSLTDYYSGAFIQYVSKQRMRFVGHNRFLKNIIYCSIGPDNHLYMTAEDPDFLELQRVKLTGVFQDTEKAAELESCEGEEQGDKPCDPWDKEFPIEEKLIPQLIELVVKELSGASWRPQDDSNNAQDDLASLASYIAQNTKSDLQKKMQGNG